MNPDGSVSFSLNAPGAKVVALQGQVGAGPMTRDNKGVWTFTSLPLAPEIYEYEFVVDGLTLTDPRNTWARGSEASLVDVPSHAGAPPEPWEITDVPHGAVTTAYYRSAAAGGAQRRVHIYTPPGYLPSNRETYPTFYLLHGSGDDDASWVTVSRANFIFDNLIAQKAMRPMVVVMPYGFMPRGMGRDAFDQDLLNDLLPFVEQHYRVQKGAAHRALAGLSMGGGQALRLGLHHGDQFAYVGSWSTGSLGGTSPETLDAQFPQIARYGPKTVSGIKRLYVSCGDIDPRLGVTKVLDAWLSARQIHHVFRVKSGNHQWSVWRASLVEFAQDLFRE